MGSTSAIEAPRGGIYRLVYQLVLCQSAIMAASAVSSAGQIVIDFEGLPTTPNLNDESLAGVSR